MKKFYITTPIYYASGNLHIGHLYTTTIAWAFKNYKKLMGYDVRFLTGSDEHGQKIEQKAKEHNLEPQVFVDSVVDKFKQMWLDFDIDYDFFSRTSNPKHKKLVQEIFSHFLKQGYIYKGNYEGWYSIQDEEFLTETQAVKKDGKLYHPSSNHELTKVSEESYFFKMNDFSDWLKDYIKNNHNFLFPKKIENEMLFNFINKGLEDLSITRTNINWGIKINEDTKHTLYVWLDALCNYITMLDFDINNPTSSELFNDFWNDENTEVVHILGKEISRFHMIYWPIFLKALNIKQPTRIQSHGWIITPEGKMSKSKGNIIDPYNLISKYHPEMIKYFFVSQFPLGDDLVFDENRFIDVINSDLVNNFGNLVSRVLKMILQNFKKSLKYQKTTDTNNQEIELEIKKSMQLFTNYFNDFKVDLAFNVAIELGNKLNKYIDITKPWTLTNELDKLEQILVRLLNGIYAFACYLQILLPNKIKEVAKVLKINNFTFSEIQNFNKFDNLLPEGQYLFFNRIKK